MTTPAGSGPPMGGAGGMQLTQGLRRAVELRGGETAVACGERRLSWRELQERVARLAAGFRALGLQDGGRVALLSVNTHHALETYFAALWAGGVIAPLSTRLSAPELARQVADCRPTVLVYSEEFAAVAGELPVGVKLAVGEAYEALVAAHAPMGDRGRGGGDLACLFYTGGTTGEGKGVMLSHANVMANTLNVIGHMGLDENLVHLHCGPLFHVAAGVRLFLTTQLAGKHVMLPRFEAKAVLSAIEREGITLATFVPTMLRGILDELDRQAYDLSSLAYITYGAAPISPELLREAFDKLPQVRFVQSYGMTELSPVATMLGWREHRDPSGARLRSAGRAVLTAEVRVVDAHDRPVPTGERGEIVVRGPMVMQGYWEKPEATAQALRGGWMHTGDIGYLDADGYLYVVDRLKDMIVTGGENVYSQEVETVIAQHPAVRECAVIGRPDPKWGESVHAVVVPHPGRSLTAEEIIAHCRARLAAFKCPKSADIRTEPLPLSGANKVLKTKLREELTGPEAGA